MEVSEDECKAFNSTQRRNRYLDAEAKRAGAFSCNSLDTDELAGADIFVDEAVLPDQMALDSVMIDAMRCCLDELDSTERALITAIYFEEKSERQLATELGIPRKTLSYRKKKALDKLRFLMET